VVSGAPAARRKTSVTNMQNTTELESFESLVNLGRGSFQVALLTCNHHSMRRASEKWLTRRVRTERVEYRRFGLSIADRVLAIASSRSGPACINLFLELPESASHNVRVECLEAILDQMRALNLQRGAIAESLKCTLAIWCDEAILPLLSWSSPDLYSIKSGSFHLSGSPEDIESSLADQISNLYSVFDLDQYDIDLLRAVVDEAEASGSPLSSVCQLDLEIAKTILAPTPAVMSQLDSIAGALVSTSSHCSIRRGVVSLLKARVMAEHGDRAKALEAVYDALAYLLDGSAPYLPESTILLLPMFSYDRNSTAQGYLPLTAKLVGKSVSRPPFGLLVDGEVYKVDQLPYSMGRESTELTRNDMSTSRLHLTFEESALGVLCIDRSANGSLINGKRFSSTLLRYGDLLTLSWKTKCVIVAMFDDTNTTVLVTRHSYRSQKRKFGIVESEKTDLGGDTKPKPSTLRVPAILLPYFTNFDELGEGAEGKVLLALNRVSGEQAAIRLSWIGDEKTDASTLTLRRSLDARFVSEVIQSGLDSGVKYEVMTYYGGGSLAERISSVERIPIKELFILFGCVANSLLYLHNLGMVHGDVKPGNILFKGAAYSSAVLTDLSMQIAGSNPVGFTPRYADPLVPLARRATPQDMWSAGVCMLESWYGSRRVEGFSTLSRDGWQSQSDKESSAEDVAVARACEGLLNINPSLRWTAEQLVSWAESGQKLPSSSSSSA
jgi:Protein kinase domain/FHA domain